MAKEKYSEFCITDIDGKGRSHLHIYDNAEEAAKYLLNSTDKKDIKEIDDAVNKSIETGNTQLRILNVDYELGDGERCKGRRLVMINVDQQS